MRTIASLFVVVALLACAAPVQAQKSPHPNDRVRQVDLKVEPLAYAFGGAGGHVGIQAGDWNYTLEVFELEIPQSLHGNDEFTASPLGAELHVQHFFGEDVQGFYAGPEAGIKRLSVTHSASGRTERHTRYSVGLRGGYRWYPGLGNLYISPVVGVSFTLNGDSIRIGGDTFATAPVGPWGTVGVGWSVGR